MTIIFTPDRRQQVLDLLLAELDKDPRIAAVMIVGSGATGFCDEHSDIDLVAVVADGTTVCQVWDDWRQRVSELVTVWSCSEVTYNPESYLLVLMLESYPEVDLGFISMAQVTARRPEWSIAFDRTDRVNLLMQESLQGSPPLDPVVFLSRRLDGIWHYIIRAAVALQRGQKWSAAHELDVIRTRAIELACLRRGLDSRHLRAANDLRDDALASLEQTLPADTSPKSIGRALRAAMAFFFSEAEGVEGADLREVARMRKLMRQYLDAAGIPS